MKILLKEVLIDVLESMEITGAVPVVEFTTDLTHGDYTTNIAMQLARVLKRSPLEIAKEIKDKLTAYSPQFTANGQDHSTDQSDQKVSDSGKEYRVLQDIEKIEVVPPGFINFFLAPSTLSSELVELLEKKEGVGKAHPLVSNAPTPPLTKRGLGGVRKIMVEFAHPNTHKAFHIGHLRNISTGESIIRLLESQGTEVIRANYQGDVGMHIAKCLYGILQNRELKEKIESYSSSDFYSSSAARSKDNSSLRLSGGSNNNIAEKVELLGKAYATGSKAFEDLSAEGEKAKEKIKDINFLIYAAAQRFQKERGIAPSSTDYLKFVHGREAELEQIYELWKETRQWSLDYFDSIYKRVGSHFDRFYFESECLRGVDLAKEAVKKSVLEESRGAIIFNGKKYGLDTRVFVNNLGLPTYEAKELALSEKEFNEFGALNQVIHVVGPEQASFFQVTFKAEELLGIQKDQQYHLVYGWVKLKHGKMSSRLGNVVLGETLLEEAKKAILEVLNKSLHHQKESLERHAELVSASKTLEIPKQVRDDNFTQVYTEAEKDEISEKAAVAAVKYSFLKVSPKQEIAYDVTESVNINGDTGPYIQYTYARCKSVLRKANFQFPISNFQSISNFQFSNFKFNSEELLVMRLIYRFREVVREAAASLSPSVICTYLYQLSSQFNTFYNKHSILGQSSDNNAPTPPLTKRGIPPLDKRRLGGVSEFRLVLTVATARVLKNGLYLLGIETLEKM